MVKIRLLKNDDIAKTLDNSGIKYLSYVAGEIPTGNKVIRPDALGNNQEYTFTVKGIEITFDQEPDDTTLKILDRLFPTYTREGGTTLYDEMESLKSQVAANTTKIDKSIAALVQLGAMEAEPNEEPLEP